MWLSLRKKQIILVVSLLYAATQTYAGVETAEDLYVERGNIQVRKIVKVNPMGGTTIEYAKTRIESSEANTLKKAETEKSDVDIAQVSSHVTTAEPKPQNDQFEKHERVKQQNVKQQPLPKAKPALKNVVQLATVNNKIEGTKSAAVPLSDMSKRTPRLVVKTDETSARAAALLRKLKAKQQLAQATNNNGALKLTPNEVVIESDKQPLPRKPRHKRKNRQFEKFKKAERAIIGKLEFNDADMRDVTRALADISGLNFVATDEAAKKRITVFLQDISVKNALEAITKNAGLWYRQDKESGTFRIMSTKEYQKDLVVYREDVTKVYRLHQPNPMIIATAIRDLYGERVILSFGTNYDDFFTGEFNTGGGGQSGAQGGSRGGNRGGARGGNRGGGRGQSSLRGGGRSGIAGNTRGGGNNNQQKFDEKKFGATSNGAITENLTADQLEKIESALEGGSALDGGALRGVTRAQQPIYVTVNNQQNMVILRTSDTVAVDEINALIKEIDQPTPQVLLEMQVLEVDVGDAYSQLFSFGALSKDGKHRAFGLEDDDIANNGKFIYQYIDDLITVKLELLEETNQARVVSSPILLASNNRTSRLFVGEERLLIRGATLTDAIVNQNGLLLTPSRLTYETEIRNIGNSLNITPKINADGTVTLGIFQDTSSVNEGAVLLPLSNGDIQVDLPLDTVNTANIEGVVVAKDGLTVAIGGLISTAKSKRNSKIPVLGDLPYIGGLFNDRVESESRKEMVLLITPHIMKDPSETDDRSRDVVEPISVQEW